MRRPVGEGPRWLAGTAPVMPSAAPPTGDLRPPPRVATEMPAPQPADGRGPGTLSGVALEAALAPRWPHTAGGRVALPRARSLLTHAVLLVALAAIVDTPARLPPPVTDIAVLFEQSAPAAPPDEKPSPSATQVEQPAASAPAAPAAPAAPVSPPLPAKVEAPPPARPAHPKPARPAAAPKPAAPPVAMAQPSPAPAPATAAPAPAAPRMLGALSGSCPGAYTDQARRRALQGRVVVRAVVAASGAPGEVSVASSSGSAQLDRIAMDAVRICRAFPKGEAFVAEIPYVFRLVE